MTSKLSQIQMSCDHVDEHGVSVVRVMILSFSIQLIQLSHLLPKIRYPCGSTQKQTTNNVIERSICQKIPTK